MAGRHQEFSGRQPQAWMVVGVTIVTAASSR